MLFLRSTRTLGLTASYLARHPGRGFGGLKGSFVVGGFGGWKAQVHLMQPQGLPAVGRVHTATEPRPQTGFGCLPEHGPGGHSLATAASVASRTAVNNVRAVTTVAMKHPTQRILPSLWASWILPMGTRLVLGRNEQPLVWERSSRIFRP
jgi:hypothetical protein